MTRPVYESAGFSFETELPEREPAALNADSQSR